MNQRAGRRLPVLQPGEGAPPVFEKVGIVGLGLIGGSIALAARRAWPAGLVVGVDRKDVLEQAMTRHAIDVAADDLGVLSEVDLVVLAAPVRENLRLLAAVPEAVPGEAVVTDTGGTKREIMEAARALPARLAFVGGHPLGGAARSGIEHAREDLFVGRPWLLTPGPPDTTTAVGTAAGRGAAGVVERLFAFAEGLGASPRVIGVEEHDHLLAYISHLPQLVSSALMHVVGEAAGAEGLSLTGRGLQDVTRLASSPSDIWEEISASNADELGAALDAMRQVLEEIRTGLPQSEALRRVFGSAGRWREALLRSRETSSAGDGRGGRATGAVSTEPDRTRR